MAEISKQALKVENNTSFPNNNNGAITPSELRTFNIDMIDSNVNQTQYNADSASWNNSIDALEAFTSSQQPSFAALNAFTASASQSIQSLNSYTASANNRFSSLEAETAALESFTSSINQIQERSVIKGISTRLNFGGGSFVTASIVPNVNGAIADIIINSDPSKANTSSFNAFTQSADERLDSLESFTASLDTNYASQAEFNSYTQSNDTKVNALTAATASYVTSAITASSLVTASFASQVLTFTKGDGTTFDVVIPDVSGSVGNFATTGSNTFTGVNTFNERINVNGLNIYTGSVNGIYIGDKTNFAPTSLGRVPGNGHVVLGNFALENFSYGDVNVAIGWNALKALQSGSVNLALGPFAGRNLLGGDNNTFIGENAGIGLVTGSYNFMMGSSAGNILTSGSYNTIIGVNTQGTLTSGSGNLIIGFANGTKLANNVDNQVSIVYGTDASPLKLLFKSGSESDNALLYGGLEIQNTLTASLQEGFVWVGGPNNRTITVATSSFGGGGTEFIEPSLVSVSGSLALVGLGFTSASANFSHISASSVGQTNLIFKSNNNTGTTVVSGSGNIYTNPGAPTATFIRYMTAGNIALNAGAVPQISASMAFSPTISNNYFGVNAVPIQIRGPISSSAYTIQNNLLAGGQFALGSTLANNFTRASSGLSMQQNVLAGTLTATAAKTTLSASVNAVQNFIGGGLTMNMDSSSVQASGLNVQGGLTINNSYLPPVFNTVGALSVAGGVYTGFVNAIFASGSNVATGSARTIAGSSMLGSSNVMSASLNGDNSNIQSTTLIGQGLDVLGTNSRQVGLTGADYGSLFVGRWNSKSGTSNSTAETVFAVGTGTSNTARKTAFLIDSGSNTFVEGTLNVSGSSSFTGSLSIQSGSAFFANGNRQFNVGVFEANTSQSGSANVSQSMNFDTTDISEGVSIVSNSRITLANSGTYNIQFSAQLSDNGAGDSTIHIWLKKNGANVADTAGRIVIKANQELIASWNYVINAAASDYYELCWQSNQNDTRILAAGASGNIPAIPAIILTVTQVR